MKAITIGTGAALALAAAAALAQAAPQEGDGTAVVTADVNNAEGHAVAEARATQESDGVRIHVTASGMQPGTYGAHVHAVGRCDAPDFASAGGHWNPTEKHHGRLNPQGQHMGDLPNLTIGANGNGEVDYLIAGATLHGGEHPMLDDDGAAVVIHAGPDDYRSDPSGNSGARMACGVFAGGAAD
jgi:Cu-Zn family superoxide dismutase